MTDALLIIVGILLIINVILFLFNRKMDGVYYIDNSEDKYRVFFEMHTGIDDVCKKKYCRMKVVTVDKDYYDALLERE